LPLHRRNAQITSLRNTKKKRILPPHPEAGFLVSNACITLYTSRCDPLVDAAGYTKESDTCCADKEGHLGIDITHECGQRLIGLRDIHSFHDKQIVVK
jgi:hypothetical protein